MDNDNNKSFTGKRYLTIQTALAVYDLTEEELNDLINSGQVTTIVIVDDDQTVGLYDDDIKTYLANRDIQPDDFEHLRNSLLSINEATKKYDLSSGLISNWIERGLMMVVGTHKNRKLVSEADVAYLSKKARALNMSRGKNVFSEEDSK